MTLPDERYRAVLQTKKFLQDLLTTPRVPKAIKDGARSCLRHYPDTWEMQQVADASPHVFAERMEPVTRLFKKYEQDKEENNGI
jgi:hypothetical protein